MSDIEQGVPMVTVCKSLLTKREVEILKMVAHGLSNDEIAGVLCISVATAKTHVLSLLRKLNLSSRTKVALYALKRKIVSLDEIGDL